MEAAFQFLAATAVATVASSMYGVGLRVGPSFINSLNGDGLTFTSIRS